MTKNTFTHRPPRNWLKITLTVPADKVDSAASFLALLTGAGTEQITDAGNQETEKVVGYLPVDGDTEERKKTLHDFWENMKNNAAHPDHYHLNNEIIEEEDWGHTWKKQFKPLKITPHLVIKPTWENYTPAAEEKIIELDPGMAFGTGHHASTKLALELIESAVLSDKKNCQEVLDVGTGTGILAMASALFGAKHIVAIDNDPDAVAVAKENILVNGLAEKITISGENLDDLPSSFNLVIANIIHDTLIEMAPSLTGKLKAQGMLILAGILRGDQESNIRRTYENLGLSTQEIRTEDEWAAISFRKP